MCPFNPRREQGAPDWGAGAKEFCRIWGGGLLSSLFHSEHFDYTQMGGGSAWVKQKGAPRLTPPPTVEEAGLHRR